MCDISTEEYPYHVVYFTEFTWLGNILQHTQATFDLRKYIPLA